MAKIKSVVAMAKREWGLITKSCERTFGDDRSILYLYCGGSYMSVCVCVSKFIELYTKKREFN